MVGPKEILLMKMGRNVVNHLCEIPTKLANTTLTQWITCTCTLFIVYFVPISKYGIMIFKLAQVCYPQRVHHNTNTNKSSRERRGKHFFHYFNRNLYGHKFFKKIIF